MARKKTMQIVYPNTLDENPLKRGWQKDEFLKSCVTTSYDEKQRSHHVTLNLCCEVVLPKDVIEGESDDVIASLVIERLLTDVQIDVRPVLRHRIRGLLRKAAA